MLSFVSIKVINTTIYQSKTVPTPPYLAPLESAINQKRDRSLWHSLLNKLKNIE